MEGKALGRIGRGLLVLVGVGAGDVPETARALAEKVANLRVFDDHQGRMNRSLLETGASALCVSQFTLYGDCRKGRRPRYSGAASPEAAAPIYAAFVESLRDLLRGVGASVESGRFQTMMEVELVNDGPVTLMLDSEKTF